MRRPRLIELPESWYGTHPKADSGLPRHPVGTVHRCQRERWFSNMPEVGHLLLWARICPEHKPLLFQFVRWVLDHPDDAEFVLAQISPTHPL